MQVVGSADHTGVVSGLRLRSLRLSSQEQEIMLEQVSKLAAQDQVKRQHFDRFKAWLDRTGPFDVLLDGANIGYSNQRVDKGRLHAIIWLRLVRLSHGVIGMVPAGDSLQWSQIDRVAQHFLTAGLTHPIPPQRVCKPLIILHERVRS
jgi:hypothetical protein